MSEAIDSGDSQALFDSLDALHQEPIVTEVFEKIQLYNELLASERVDQARINEIMNELDSMWHKLINETAVITGVIGFKEHPKQYYDAAPKEYFEDEKVTFKGVQPVPLLSRNVSLESSHDELLYYELRILLSRQGIHDDGKTYEIPGSAHLAGIASLEFMERMSKERARYILEHYQGELIDDLDIALLEPAEHEGEVVCRLSGLVYDDSYDDEETQLQVIRALDIYTQSRIEFDGVINGYVAAVKGPFWLIDKDGETTQCLVPEATPALMSIERVEWQRSPEHGNDMVVPHVAFRLCKEGSTVAGEDLLLIPVESIMHCTPLRYQYHKNQ